MIVLELLKFAISKKFFIYGSFIVIQFTEYPQFDGVIPLPSELFL